MRYPPLFSHLPNREGLDIHKLTLCVCVCARALLVLLCCFLSLSHSLSFILDRWPLSPSNLQMASRIQYSEKYDDGEYEYRFVFTLVLWLRVFVSCISWSSFPRGCSSTLFRGSKFGLLFVFSLVVCGLFEKRGGGGCECVMIRAVPVFVCSWSGTRVWRWEKNYWHVFSQRMESTRVNSLFLLLWCSHPCPSVAMSTSLEILQR